MGRELGQGLRWRYLGLGRGLETGTGVRQMDLALELGLGQRLRTRQPCLGGWGFEGWVPGQLLWRLGCLTGGQAGWGLVQQCRVL